MTTSEKILMSLSFIFTLNFFKPLPLYFMDEIDTLLDFRYLERIISYIQVIKKTIV